MANQSDTFPSSVP